MVDRMGTLVNRQRAREIAMKKLEDVERRRMNTSDLAFEEDLPEGEPSVLWRLVSYREYKGRRIRHVNWFADVEACVRHGKWINDKRGTVVSMTKYCREPSPEPWFRSRAAD